MAENNSVSNSKPIKAKIVLLPAIVLATCSTVSLCIGFVPSLKVSVCSASRNISYDRPADANLLDDGELALSVCQL